MEEYPDQIKELLKYSEDSARLRALDQAELNAVAKNVIDAAIVENAEKLNALMSDPTVDGFLRDFAEESDRSIDALKLVLDMNLGDSQKIVEQIKIIESDPLYQLKHNIGRVALSHEVQNEPHDNQQESEIIKTSPETNENETKEIAIGIKKSAIEIGRGGILIKVTSSKSRSLLRALISCESSDGIVAKDLWEMAFPGQSYDPSTMRNFRLVLDRITYGRKPIFVCEATEGKPYKYIKKYAVKLVEITNDDDDLKNASDVKVNEPSESVPEETGEALTSDEEEPDSFPLNKEEASVLAALLGFFEDMLPKYGFPTLDGKVIEDYMMPLTELT
jgi:hypothetical protein